MVRPERIPAAALTAGLTGGGDVSGLTLGQKLVVGAINNAVGQGVNVALGLQSSFSWRDVAISAVAAPASSAAGNWAGKQLGSIPSATIQSLGVNLAQGVTSAAIRQTLGGKVDFQSVFADAFANVIGNSIVGALTPKPSVPKTSDPVSTGTSASSDDLQEIQIDARRRTLSSDTAPAVLNPTNRLTADEQLEEVVVTAQKRSLYGSNVSVHANETLTGIAAKELGKGATQLQILTRAKQYMDVNGITDPTTVQAGAKLIVPAFNQSVADVTEQNFLASDAKVQDRREASVTAKQSATTTDGTAAQAQSVANGASGAQSSGFASRQAALIAQRASIDQVAAGLEGSVWGDLAANSLRLFGHGGNSLFQAGNALYAFATDQQVFDKTVSGLKYTATHLPQLYDSAVSSTTDFYGLSAADQATAFGEAGINFLVAGGGTEIAGAAGAGVLKVGRYALDSVGTGPLAGSRAAQIGAVGNLGNSSEGEFVTLFRGDSTRVDAFYSKMARESGIDASNEAVALAERQGNVSDIFARHSVTSESSPYISFSSSRDVAEQFARGINGDQAGFVSEVRIPRSMAQYNFESIKPSEFEFLIPTKVDSGFIVRQYPVGP